MTTSRKSNIIHIVGKFTKEFFLLGYLYINVDRILKEIVKKNVLIFQISFVYMFFVLFMLHIYI